MQILFSTNKLQENEQLETARIVSLIQNPHDYQSKAIDDIFDFWGVNVERCYLNLLGYKDNKIIADIQNALLVSPTGSGKTVIKAFLAKKLLSKFPSGFVLIFAHRDVLLSQISLTLAKCGMYHSLLCSKPTARKIGDVHTKELGHAYLSKESRIVVASVPTWVRRDTKPIKEKTIAWLMDESHHLTKESIWEKAISGLHNALGCGVTATPKRADKKGLGRHSDGVFDQIIQTKTMGELIGLGRLSNYRIYTIPSRLDTSDINITSGGDFNQQKLALATDRPDITGDAVEHYLRLAKGKQAITFAVSIDHAHHIAEQFNQAGIETVALSSKDDINYRHDQITRFRNGEIKNLVNVDLFGEGFDVPAVEVVIMLRKTLSYSLFKQMFGRMLRVFEGKEYGLLIDHVGNVLEHCIYGEPHDDPEWSLESDKKRKSNDDGIKITGKICPKCWAFYIPKNPAKPQCPSPSCNHILTPKEKSSQDQKIKVGEGQLIEYTVAQISQIKKEIKRIDEPVEKFEKRLGNAPRKVRDSAVKKHQIRQDAQKKLRSAILSWCSEMAYEWDWDIETTKIMFSKTFNVSTLKAQTLGATESEKLYDEIMNHE